MRMKQQTLAMAADQGAGFEQYRRPTKRDVFLETMEQIVPWTQLCEVAEIFKLVVASTNKFQAAFLSWLGRCGVATWLSM